MVPGTENFNTPLNIEAVIKQLNEDESSQYLKSLFNTRSVFAKVKDFKVPNFGTFNNEKDPDWSSGATMARITFESLVHFELSVYWLYKGSLSEASHHFKSQKSKPEQYSPYLKITSVKMDGYRKALGLQGQTAGKIEKTYKTSALDYSNVEEMAKFMREGQFEKFRHAIAPSEEPLTRKSEKLRVDKIDTYEASLMASGESLALVFFNRSNYVLLSQMRCKNSTKKN